MRLIICHTVQGARQARFAGKTTATPNNNCTTKQLNVQSSLSSTKSTAEKRGGNSLQVGYKGI